MSTLVQSQEAIRSRCRTAIETLELWLRRIIDEAMTAAHGTDYWTQVDPKGNRIISKRVADPIISRSSHDPTRYPRIVDAALFEDLISIICNPEHYARHFSAPLGEAFPEGNEEARTFLSRLIQPRNRLAHANPISAREEERVVCYSNDIIDSLKAYYLKLGRYMAYNVPSITRYSDSIGHTVHAPAFKRVLDGQGVLDFTTDSKSFLRPGDSITMEIETDASFPSTEFSIAWSTVKGQLPLEKGSTLVLPITEEHVSQRFTITCTLTSLKKWHRFPTGVDDILLVFLKILPPIE